MPNYFAEIFIDQAPMQISKETSTVNAGKPWTAAARALSAALKERKPRHRVHQYTIRLTKIS